MTVSFEFFEQKNKFGIKIAERNMISIILKIKLLHFMKGLFLCFAFFLVTSTSAFSQFVQTPTSFKTSTYLTEEKPEAKKFQIFKKKNNSVSLTIKKSSQAETEVYETEVLSQESKNERIRTVVAKRFRREKLLSNAGLIISTALLSTFLK
jgi:predicted NAD-dependent protein-ADP-ribosyltransferase YbiA (DUF1768 family)